MSKTRVYELARKLEITSKELVLKLREIGIQVNGYQSSLTLLQADKARKKLFQKENPEEKQATILRRRKVSSPQVQSDSSQEQFLNKDNSSRSQLETPLKQEEESGQKAEVKIDLDFSYKASADPALQLKKEEKASESSIALNKQEQSKIDLKKEQQDSNKIETSVFIESDEKKKKSTSSTPLPIVESATTQESSSLKEKKKEQKNKKFKKTKSFQVVEILKEINLKKDLNASSDEQEAPSSFKKKSIYTPKGASSYIKRSNKKRSSQKTQVTKPRASYRVVKMGEEIEIAELARQLHVKTTEIIKNLSSLGVNTSLQNEFLDFDTATIIANEYEFSVESNIIKIDDILAKRIPKVENLKTVIRPPIVTVMGHVDHGKTSILDAIRKTNLTKRESGGITQHIGGYIVTHQGNKITFLDTPGHEAFSAMRARGSYLTDLVILVVAADDGVMPQTLEAISHAQAANVPIIVAINKIDKANKNLDHIYTQLAKYGVQAEKWGGETQCIEVSALKNMGLNDLLDAVLLQSEMLELKADLNQLADGVIIESQLDRHKGSIVTAIIQNGILHKGDYIVSGLCFGRVRTIYDDQKCSIAQAGPSMPVEILGFSQLPQVGDQLYAFQDDKDYKSLIELNRNNQVKRQESRKTNTNLDTLLDQVRLEEIPVPLIIKADKQGSLEAIVTSILKLNTEKIKNKIVHQAVGGITESDLLLAQTTKAVIFVFNIRASKNLDILSEKHGITIHYFDIIYDLIDSIKNIMIGRLPPQTLEEVQGHAEVRSLIPIPKVGIVAGAMVLDGKIIRGSSLRLLREQVIVYNGVIASLRRFKNDVKEVESGFECGISIENYHDLKEGDIIETYTLKEIPSTLD